MNICIRLVRTSLLVLVSILALQTVCGQVTVRGTITRCDKRSKLAGVSVRVRNTPQMTKTDKNGQFSFCCLTKESVLLIDAKGYSSREIEVGEQTNIELQLEEQGYSIKETTVVGYGVQTKNDFTGKPVIYLYPPTPTNVSLKVNYNGKMETTYPAYKGGWKVNAEPDGTLHNLADGKEYSYLFWDGIKQYTKADLSYNTGFVVAADTALEFLQNVLPQMGLMPREYNEFIVYWLPFLQKNALNFVHFRVGNDYNVISQNEVSPAPNTEIRVFMEFQAVTQFVTVAPQQFTKPTRKGFTLVEWGGTEIKDEIFIDKINDIVTVTGTVMDGKFGGPLPVATVKVKGTTSGAQTDFDGNFSIKCKTTDSIVISFMGYETRSVKVGDKTKFDITLKEKASEIKEQCTVGKPVIYLYPPTPTNVSLKVNYNGKMETTYPAYKGGWEVNAEPDGTLHNLADGKEYSYLFWDGIKQYTKAELSYNTGFVVAADTALQFLQNVLPQMGLTPREYNEFIVYWLPFLQKNALNFVHFRLGNAYNIISQNEVSPAPDTEIRVFMEFQAVKQFVKVAPQQFTKPTRKGFTLVEWGGTEIKDEIFIAKEK